LTIGGAVVSEDQVQRQTPGHRLSAAQPHREMVLLALASVLATIPVWVASYPPMVDLPQHAAQVAMLRNLHDPNFRFAGLFEVNWFTPYLVGYMAVYALAPLLGIVAACKLVISAALAALPLGTGFLMKETGADPYWALLTIPAMYGFAYEWGFLNFLVGAPLGLFFLVFVMRHVRKPSWATSVWLGLFPVLLFFCHVLICGFFGLIAGIYILAHARKLRKALVAMAPMACVIPIMVTWYIRAKSHSIAQPTTSWDLGWVHGLDSYSLGGRLTGFFPRLLGLEANPICIVMGASLFALPWLAGARPVRRGAVWVPLAVCLGVLLFAPTVAFDIAYIFQRFTLLALPFFLVGMQRSEMVRPAWRGAVVFLLIGWMIVLTAPTLRFDAQAKGFNEILSKMDSNQRALSLMFLRDTDSIPSPVFLHFPLWYSAIKKGVVDVNFALLDHELVVYKPDKIPAVQTGFELSPETFTWSGMNGGAYRYFVVRAPFDMGYKLFRGAPCRITLAAHSGDWWLYEKDPHCSPSDSLQED